MPTDGINEGIPVVDPKTIGIELQTADTEPVPPSIMGWTARELLDGLNLTGGNSSYSSIIAAATAYALLDLADAFRQGL